MRKEDRQSVLKDLISKSDMIYLLLPCRRGYRDFKDQKEERGHQLQARYELR